MSSSYAVNKSGYSIPVYDFDESRIGTLYDGEAYVIHGLYALAPGKVGNTIHFLNSAGDIEWGIIVTNDQNCKQHMEYYPYGKADVFGNGKPIDVFKMRRIENIYTGAGNYWGQVAAGSLVRVHPFSCGDTHFDWCQITYVQKSDGTWQKVDGDGYNYGYIDVGLNHGSFSHNISMYGSW